MRWHAPIAPALLVACAVAPSAGNGQPAERCESTSCFNQMQIRKFEVVNETTLIVYVGAQECPFLVELTGTFCDVTFLPGYNIVFRPSEQRAAREPTLGSGLHDRADIAHARVCANDLDMGIQEGPFSSAIGDNVEVSGLDCRIQNVKSLTDDEILEIYVDNSFTPPPPPFGTGNISVKGDGDEDADADANADAAPADEPDSRRRRRRRSRSDD